MTEKYDANHILKTLLDNAASGADIIGPCQELTNWLLDGNTPPEVEVEVDVLAADWKVTRYTIGTGE